MKLNYMMAGMAAGVAGLCAAETEKVGVLPEVTVSATAISKYRAEETASALVPFAAEESPQVVDVLTEDFIRDRNPTDLDNLLSFQPGIYTGGRTIMSRTAGQYTIRGMTGSQVLLNGTIPMSSSMGSFMDSALIERVEIPKGPVGAVYGGQGDSAGAYGAGGAIVVFQKRARVGEEFGSAEIRSSFAEGGAQRYRLIGDVNGSVGGDTVWVRLPLGVDFNRSFWLQDGYRWSQSFTIAPSMRIEGERVRVGVDTAINTSDRPAYQGIAITNGVPKAGYDWDTNLSLDGMRDKYFGAVVLPWIEADVTDTLTLRAGGGVAWSIQEWDRVGPGSGRTLYENSTGNTRARNYSAYLHAAYTLETAPVMQTITVGTDWTRQIRTGKSTFTGGTLPQFIDRNTLTSTTTDTIRYGAFVNDGIEAGDLRLLLGTRANHFRSASTGNAAWTWSPRIGASYLVTPWLIPFANAMQTVTPNFGLKDVNTNELTSSWTATQYEGGVRVAPADDFWLTVSVFHIKQKNSALLVSGDIYTDDGETVTQGIEVSAAGDILPNWSASVAWAFIDFDNKNSSEKYNRFPRNAASVYTTYKLEGGALDGTVFGFGYRYRSDYEQTLRGVYQGPGFTIKGHSVFDVSVETPLPKKWSLGEASLSLAVKNLFDKHYIESTRNTQNFPGDPRTFELALRTRF